MKVLAVTFAANSSCSLYVGDKRITKGGGPAEAEAEKICKNTYRWQTEHEICHKIQGVTLAIFRRVSRGFHVMGTLLESCLKQTYKMRGVTLAFFNGSVAWVPRNGYPA